jgi:hypothetical protein
VAPSNRQGVELGEKRDGGVKLASCRAGRAEMAAWLR